MRPAVERAVASFLVSFLPGRLQLGRLRHVASPVAVAVSGFLEAVTAAILHLTGFVRSIEGFLSGEGLTFFQQSPVKVDLQAMQGAGLVGMMSYLVSPWALCLVYHAFEGTVRLAEALVEGRLRGVAVLSVPDALARAAGRAKAVALEISLGPPRPTGSRRSSGRWWDCGSRAARTSRGPSTRRSVTARTTTTSREGRSSARPPVPAEPVRAAPAAPEEVIRGEVSRSNREAEGL